MKILKKFKAFILLICLFIPLSLAGCQNTNKDTLPTPLIVEVKGGTIVFEQVADAEYYTISINNIEIHVDVKYNNNVEIIDNLIHYDASKIFVVGDSYSVKVRANSNAKANSQFSSGVSYKHSGPIKTPTNVKINGTTLTWSTVENASYYVVKLTTPNDNIIFDKDGNVLTLDDPENIAIADLSEYSFNTNKFDFSSLLSSAGNYNFYVCAILSNGLSYVESDYSSKVSYINYVTLNAPTNGHVFNNDGELHMLTALDSNANAISIRCEDVEKTAEINNSELSITKINDNYFDINLTQYFESFINAGKLDFNQAKQFKFSTQSKYISASVDDAYFLNSSYSLDVIYESTKELDPQQLNLEKFGDEYMARWTISQPDLISGFKLVLFTNTGLKEYSLNSNILNMLISEQFVAVAVQTIGKGNYLSSCLSNLIASESNTSDITGFNYSFSGTTLSWNNVSGAYYVVELNNKLYYTATNSFNIPTDEIATSDFVVKVHVIKNGCAPLTTIIDATHSTQLAKPTFSASQGFNGSNLYELTFTGVENAIGYYIHIKSATSNDFVKINTLYTTTKINLSHYICSAGEFTDYQVKVQAVADKYSTYSDSELSSAVSVSHVQVLESPTFCKINGVTTPVIKQISGNTTSYFLQFDGVENADSYEILINFNKLTVAASNLEQYKINITNYLPSANNYEIKVRAIPATSAINVEASEYAVANYALTKQLKSVENINITENNGVFTLSFDPVENAENYRVRIVKENDNSYSDYLNSLNPALFNVFEVSTSHDVTKYVQQAGTYYFYVTALAAKNSYYADSNESSEYGELRNKLKSLVSPTSIGFANKNSTSYKMNWIGDENADFYLVKLTDPNGILHELIVEDSTEVELNEFMTIQGTYSVEIYSMIDPNGEKAKEFVSSSATMASEFYTYKYEHDLERYKISLYGTKYDFVVKDVNQLKTLLWYHYLYEIDQNIGLNLTIKQLEKQVQNPQALSNETETLREALIRIANEAHNKLLYAFNNDEIWLNYRDNSATDTQLFAYICEKLLSIYPEHHIMSKLNIELPQGSTIFNLKYKNNLNVEKIDYADGNLETNDNYGNEYDYIDLYSRKNANGFFNIDSRTQSALVSTTEQLLQVVQYGYKPQFVGDSSVAETVYSNAKMVLSTIIKNKMTDLEKVTAIFDWLEAEFDISYYNISEQYYISGSIENEVSKYGKYKNYYLEGVFEDISMEDNGDLVIGNRNATSWSYSKAFALLCGIEGIDATIVNGTYTYTKGTGENKEDVIVDHVWNKVYVDTSLDQTAGKKWYAVDLTFSDNRIFFATFKDGYGISSHSYFLTSDNYLQSNLSLVDYSYMISNEYATSRMCWTNYDYYSNSNFGLTLNQIKSTILDFEVYKNKYVCSNCDHETIAENEPSECENCHALDSFEFVESVLTTSGFNYRKKFNASTKYQEYLNKDTGKEADRGALQSFYINSLIYAGYHANNNASKKSVFEFKINKELFKLGDLTTSFNTTNAYQLKLSRKYDSAGTNTIYTINSDNNEIIVVCRVEKQWIKTY